jgi:hypothetical protein
MAHGIALVGRNGRGQRGLSIAPIHESENAFVVNEPHMNRNIGLHPAFVGEDVAVGEVGKDDVTDRSENRTLLTENDQHKEGQVYFLGMMVLLG